MINPILFSFFFFNDTATTEIYTLSLHDALPIFGLDQRRRLDDDLVDLADQLQALVEILAVEAEPLAEQLHRSEEHTSELQSRLHLVCRLLLEKKKKQGSCRTSQHWHSTHGRRSC